MPPRNANTSRDGKRFYDWRGERFWSVTTIISAGVPKPALIPWGIKSVAEGAVEAVEKGTLVGMVEQDRDAAVQFLKGLPYAKRDRAAKLGTEVHEAIDAYHTGRPMPTWPLPVRPVMEQFLSFLDYHQPEIEASEEEVYNRTQAYAGTLDAIARFPRLGGERLVLDAKTGKDIYSEVALQLAAYRFAEFLGLPDGTERPMPETAGAVVLHLTPEGWALRRVPLANEDGFRVFLWAREIARWMWETSKEAIGPPLRMEEEVPA